MNLRWRVPACSSWRDRPAAARRGTSHVTALGVDSFNIDDRCAQILGSYRAISRDVRVRRRSGGVRTVRARSHRERERNRSAARDDASNDRSDRTSRARAKARLRDRASFHRDRFDRGEHRPSSSASAGRRSWRIGARHPRDPRSKHRQPADGARRVRTGTYLRLHGAVDQAPTRGECARRAVDIARHQPGMARACARGPSA